MAVALEGESADHAVHARELLEKLVFVPELGQRPGAWVRALEQLDHPRRAIQAAAPIQPRLLPFVKDAGQWKGPEYLYSRISHDGTHIM